MERSELESYSLLSGVGAYVFPNQDTITKGEEYIACIEYIVAP